MTTTYEHVVLCIANLKRTHHLIQSFEYFLFVITNFKIKK